MPDPPCISVAELADGAADLPLLPGTGELWPPLLAVDLDGIPDGAAAGTLLDRAAARAAGCPRLLVGLASGPPPAHATGLLRTLGLTLTAARATGRECVTLPDPADGLAALSTAAARRPQAAVVLGQVLRAAAELPVPAALDVESLAYSTLLGGPEFRSWLAARPARPLPPLAAEPVLVRREQGDAGRDGGDRLLITLNRPGRRNAYGRQLRDALTDALRVAVADPTVTVVLDGAGPCFSAGGDLAEFGTTPDPVTAHFVRTQAGAALLLHALRDRAEVRVHGPCVGAGVELPAFAGTVTAAAGTTFTLPEVGLGLIPGAGGTVSLSRRVGRWRTLYLALAGRPLDAGTALAWGLVDRLLTHG